MPIEREDLAQFDVENTMWSRDEPYAVSIARIKAVAARAGKPGFNEFGVPLHACNGYIMDNHVFEWIANRFGN